MAVWSITNTVEINKNKRIDSEFFHPNYIHAEKLVSCQKKVLPLGKLGNFIIGPFGSAFHVQNYDSNSDYRYIRGKDVKPFTLLDDDNVYMPYADFARLKRYSIQENDLLISVVGTLGNVAVVPKGIKGIFSCKSTVFRDSSIDPYYLLAYFNSKYGRECLLRRQRGAIQTGLNKDDLKTVPVPTFEDEIQKEIGNNIRLSLGLNEQAKALYKQASNLLVQELGLDKTEFTKPKSYTAKLSDAIYGNRFDADYFQPQYVQLLNHLTQFEVKEISHFSEKLETGIYSSSYSLDQGIDYIRGTDIMSNGTINANDLLKTNVILPNKQNSVIKDDILVTRVGSIGVCAIVLNENKAIYSDNLIRIRINQSNKSKISAKYLLLFLQSKYGQMLMTRLSGGSVQQRLNQSMLKKIPVPIIDYNIQLRIETLYNNSILASNQSELLLSKAREKVEQLIEQVA